MRILRWMSAVLVVLVGLGSNGAAGQDYPNKAIHINTGGTGSVGNLVSRLMAPKLSERLAQQVLVENRPSGPVLGGIVAKATPDGHTLLVTGNSFWLLPHFQSDLSWDPVRDFEPISLLTSSPNVLVVHPSIPAKTVKELIAYLKERPGKIHWGSGPLGTGNHLAGELFRIMAKVDIVRVPYKGVGQALNDLIGGRVQMMFPASGAMTPHLKSGRLRALAVASLSRSTLVPDLPTVAEAGLPGFESVSIVGMFAPAKTPSGTIDRLNKEVVGIMSTAEIKERLMGAGVEALSSSPKEFGATVKSDLDTVGRIIKDGGVKLGK